MHSARVNVRNPDSLRVLYKALIEECEECSCKINIIKNLQIVVDEIYSNIKFYAYDPNKVGYVDFIVKFNNEDLTITLIFKDTGIAFDPTKKEEPDIKQDVSKRKIGGLGLFMVKSLTDSIEYKRAEETNMLYITKKII